MTPQASVAEVLAAVFGGLVLLQSAAIVVLVIAWRRSRRLIAHLSAAQDAERRWRRRPRSERIARNAVRQVANVRRYGVAGVVSSSLDELLSWAVNDRDRITRVAARDGTVTLMFSDIVDSTALNESLGDTEWVRVLGNHTRLVRRGVDRHGGSVVKSIGDGFMAVFPDAASAALAATAIQRELHRDRRGKTGGALRVRIGVHTGTVISTGDDYLGRNVALCARIAAHATAGQTLVSAHTRFAAEGAPGLEFVLEGEFAFKGIIDAVAVYSVVARADRPVPVRTELSRETPN